MYFSKVFVDIFVRFLYFDCLKKIARNLCGLTQEQIDSFSVIFSNLRPKTFLRRKKAKCFLKHQNLASVCI